MELVSIIIPTHNRADRISKSIQSCLNQTYKYLEIIIIDDASVDNTYEIVAAFPDNRISYHKVDFKQANKSRNYGLTLAQGEYIQFLDSDDILYPTKIEKQLVKLISDNSDCCITDFQRDGEVVSNQNPVKKLFHFHSLFTASPLYLKSSLIEEFKWNENLNRHQDFEFFVRYFTKERQVSYIAETLCEYIEHENERISDNYDHGYDYEQLVIKYIEFAVQLKSQNVYLTDLSFIDHYLTQMISKQIEALNLIESRKSMTRAKSNGLISLKNQILLLRDFYRKRISTFIRS